MTSTMPTISLCCLVALFSQACSSPLWGPVFVYQRPIDAMVDITNDLGISVLQDHVTSRGNFAFSPYGVASVLVLLYEGARGESARQIHNTMRFPWQRDVTRIGFRDIHRHLRTYFSHEGYLSGITLSKVNTSLLPEYQRVLRFYGYDVSLGKPVKPKPIPPSGVNGPFGDATDAPTTTDNATTTGTEASTEGIVSTTFMAENSTMQDTSTDKGTNSTEKPEDVTNNHTAATSIDKGTTSTDKGANSTDTPEGITSNDTAATSTDKGANSTDTPEGITSNDTAATSTDKGANSTDKPEGITSNDTAATSMDMGANSTEKPEGVTNNDTAATSTDMVATTGMSDVTTSNSSKTEIPPPTTEATSQVPMEDLTHPEMKTTPESSDEKPEAAPATTSAADPTTTGQMTSAGEAPGASSTTSVPGATQTSPEASSTGTILPGPALTSPADSTGEQPATEETQPIPGTETTSVPSSMMTPEEPTESVASESTDPTTVMDSTETSTLGDASTSTEQAGTTILHEEENVTRQNDKLRPVLKAVGDIEKRIDEAVEVELTEGDQGGREERDTTAFSASEDATATTEGVPTVEEEASTALLTSEDDTATTEGVPTVEEEASTALSTSEDDTATTEGVPTVEEEAISPLSISEDATVTTERIPTMEEEASIALSTSKDANARTEGVPTVEQDAITALSPSEDVTDTTEGVSTVDEAITAFSTTPGGPTESTEDISTVSVEEAVTDLAEVDSFKVETFVDAVLANGSEGDALRRPKRVIQDPANLGYPDISLQLQNGMYGSHVSRGDSLMTQLPRYPFLVDGVTDELVPVMSYTAVFPYAFIPRIHALALEFPLDDERYRLLIILPVERRGLKQLIYDMSSCPLRDVYEILQPTRVHAVIPSFMVEGFVILTSTLQQLGIWDVFDPRRSDLSGMSSDPELYVRNIEQSITVVIRNYVEIVDIQTRTMAARSKTERFEATHPFLYFVVDTETHVALMAGKIIDPLNSRIY